MPLLKLQAEPESIEFDLSRTAFVVVDMQNAFLSQGGYFDLLGYDISASRKTIGPCQALIGPARKKGARIIYLQMGYSPDLSDTGGPDSPGWRKSKALNLIQDRPAMKEKLYIYGTWGAEIIEELKPQEGDVVVKKQKHDGFIGTNLEIVLKTYDIRYLFFVGVATNICVESTLRHAFSLGYFCILVSDAVNQMGPGSNQEATLANVRSTFGWVTTAEKFLHAIR